MSRRLSGAVAVVTGATRGLGHGIATELGAAGATVYVTGRRSSADRAPGTVEAAAALVDDAGGVGIPVRCDHADDDQTAALFDRVHTESGWLDVLVNCATSAPVTVDAYAANFQPFWQGEPRVWDTWCNVGLRSHYVASTYAARIMVSRGSGLIANVSSGGAEHYFHCTAYGVGKAALERFTADAAIELRSHGVAVVAVRPGLVSTESTREFERAGLTTLQDAETPELTGRAIVALATDPAVLERSGQAFYAAALARQYGFTDLDGTVPDLPTYGGLIPPENAAG